MGNNAHSYNYDPIGTRNSALDNGGDTVSNLTTSVVSDYTYDHQSRRISKKVFNSSLITQQSSFIYDGWNLICEQTSTNTSSFIPHTSSFYVWGLDLSGSLQGAGGVGGLLSTTISTPSTASTYLTCSDANGNITEYINTNGTVVAHYEYDSFGNTTATSGAMANDFVFRFSSKYLDAETGLYYYGYRYYDPAQGRWISRDPKEEDAFLFVGEKPFLGNTRLRSNRQLYLCCRNNPVSAIDVLGLMTEQACRKRFNEETREEIDFIRDLKKSSDGIKCINGQGGPAMDYFETGGDGETGFACWGYALSQRRIGADGRLEALWRIKWIVDKRGSATLTACTMTMGYECFCEDELIYSSPEIEPWIEIDSDGSAVTDDDFVVEEVWWRIPGNPCDSVSYP